MRALQAVSLPAPVCQEPPPSPLLDQITFGDSTSEAAHAFAGRNTILGTGPFGETNRRIDVGAPLVFQLASAPNAQNYLTIKLWGSDPDPAVLFLYVGGTRVGKYQGDLSELDLNVGEPAFPERFIYVTYPLPRSMTDGRISAELEIDAVGSVSAFAAPGAEEKPLTRPTRPLYGAYVHTDPFFVPPAAEAQGSAPAPTIRSAAPDYPNIAQLHQETDAAVETLLGWQLYGDPWSSAVVAGQIPRVVLGIFSPGATTNALSTAAAWRDWAVSTATAANAAGLNALAVLAIVFQSPWSRYHASPEILSRVTAALDSLALMQGDNGGFTSPTWVGAPARTTPAGSATEGSGTKALGRAVGLLSDALNAAGLLDAPLDQDDDAATPPVSRRQAWVDMLVRHRDFLASAEGRSQDTMYDQSQMEALWLANDAVRALDPARALTRDVALGHVDTALGLADGPFDGRSVSPRGLALEPSGTLAGSYDGRWGILTIRSMCALAHASGDAAIRGKCVDAVRASAPFLYPSSDSGAQTMRAESAISAMVNQNPGFIEYGGNAYAAAVLEDAVALRSYQLRLSDHAPLDPPQSTVVHYAEDLAWYLQDLASLEVVLALPPSPYRFPMEKGQPDFAWADEMGGMVALQNCGDRLYAALNWRRGFTDGVADAQHARVNDIARIHLTRDAYDRIATVVMDSPAGFGRFYSAAFGPYLVGMNLSSDTTYDLSPPPTSRAFDLVSRRRMTGPTVAVAPHETRVLYRQSP